MPNNMVLLETIELNASAASVTFDNLPTSGYTDLKVVMSVRNVTNTETTGAVYFNADTTNANYSARRLLGDGSAASSANTANPYFFYMDTTGETANTFANCEMYIPNYRGSTQKSVSVESVTENNATGALAVMVAGLWTGTAAITSIQVRPYTAGGGSFAANSTFSLYGIAALGTTPAIAPKADGGNVIATDGTYWYHAFTSSGSFVPQVGLTADVLVVAGGGGGGASGAGAGGLLLHSSQSLANGTNYSCTVGAGGTGNTASSTNSTNGVNSQFAALTASVGGGYGGRTASNSGNSGGSGGGAFSNSGTVVSGSSPTSGQGNSGGSSANDRGGGGGGAGAAGGNGSAPAAGVGGIGSSTYSSWGLATNTGHNVSSTYYYAGGGGSFNGTSGGSGGGGQGVSSGTGGAAIANTGGGGGGGDSFAGGNGGSGIVIIRYPIA